MDAILLTHYHGDHIFGLPGLWQTMAALGRTEPVLMAGPGLSAGAGLLAVGDLPLMRLAEDAKAGPLPVLGGQGQLFPPATGRPAAGMPTPARLL